MYLTESRLVISWGGEDNLKFHMLSPLSNSRICSRRKKIQMNEQLLHHRHLKILDLFKASRL